MDAPSLAHETLSSHCQSILRQPRLAELKFCILAAAFVAIDGPRRCGFSTQGNYAREVLGISGPAFSRRHKIGLYLLHSREARRGLLGGRFSISALELLLSHIPASHADELLPLLAGRSLSALRSLLEARIDSPDATVPSAHIGKPPDRPDPFIRLRLRVPEALARLHESNLRLARLLCGNDVEFSACPTQEPSPNAHHIANQHPRSTSKPPVKFAATLASPPAWTPDSNPWPANSANPELASRISSSKSTPHRSGALSAICGEKNSPSTACKSHDAPGSSISRMPNAAVGMTPSPSRSRTAASAIGPPDVSMNSAAVHTLETAVSRHGSVPPKN